MTTWFGAVFALLMAVGCGSSASTQPEPEAASAQAEDDPSTPVEEVLEEVAEPAPAAPATLIGEWVIDPACIPQQRGMEGADPATIDAVAAQMSQIRYRYTETEFEQTNPALPRPVVQPYTVLSHEGATWTYELAGPTGAAMEITATLSEGQLQLRREGALELCLRRPE